MEKQRKILGAKTGQGASAEGFRDGAEGEIALADKEDQGIAQAQDIQAEGVFHGVVGVIEIDPNVIAAGVIDPEVVAADVAVFFAPGVEAGDGPAGAGPVAQEAGQAFVEIGLVVGLDVLDGLVQALAPDDVEHAHQIPGRVGQGKALHEAAVAPDHIQDAGLFLLAAVTQDHRVPEFLGKGLVENELEYFGLFGFQAAAALDPIFDVLDAEAAFDLVAQDQVMQPAQADDVAVVDVHDVGGVGEDLPGVLDREGFVVCAQEVSGGWAHGRSWICRFLAG